MKQLERVGMHIAMLCAALEALRHLRTKELLALLLVAQQPSRLASTIESLRTSVSEHAEQVGVLRLQLEEERTRTIMLDEERSRLSHDNSAVRNRLDEAKVSRKRRTRVCRDFLRRTETFRPTRPKASL